MLPQEPKDSQHHSSEATWTEAEGLSDREKLLKALAERSGGSMTAKLLDVFHIAQRRHRFSGSFDHAWDCFGRMSDYITDLDDDGQIFVKRAS